MGQTYCIGFGGLGSSTVTILWHNSGCHCHPAPCPLLPERSLSCSVSPFHCPLAFAEHLGPSSFLWSGSYTYQEAGLSGLLPASTLGDWTPRLRASKTFSLQITILSLCDE